MDFKASVRRFQESDEEMRRLERLKDIDPRAKFDYLRRQLRQGGEIETRPQPVEPYDKPVKRSTVRYMQTFAPERFKKGIEPKAHHSDIDKERAKLLDSRRISRWYELKSRHDPLSNRYPRRGREADKDDYERHRSVREPIRKRLKLLRAAKHAGEEKLSIKP